MMRSLFGLMLFVSLSYAPLRAQRIYGGQIDRQILNTTLPYSYGVVCTFFTDKAAYNILPDNLRLGIYRKRDNQLIREFSATKSASPNQSKTATSCDRSSNVEYIFVKYTENLILTPQVFNDPEGYYIVNAPVGPRNSADNITSSDIVLYHWFSPQYLWEYFDPAEAGKTAPQWLPDSFNFFCNNAESNFSLMVVSDPQKTGLTSHNFNLSLTNKAPLTSNPNGSVPYQNAQWKTGFSENQMLPGGNFVVPQPPVIFSSQGQANLVVSARPTRTGVFSVGFLLRHSRAGILLSEIYREYQIQVEECLPPPPATIRLSEVGNPQTIASSKICEGKSVQLNAGAGQPNVKYEWFKNNTLIPNQNDSVLVVAEEGSYKVVLTKTGACFTSTSPTTAILLVPNPQVTVSSTIAGGILCPNDSLKFTTLVSEPLVRYQWFRNNTLLTTTTATYVATQAGIYSVKVIDQNLCVGESSPYVVSLGQNQPITFHPIPSRCVSDTTAIPLIGSPLGGLFSGKGVIGEKFYPHKAGAGIHELSYRFDNPNFCVIGATNQTAEVWALPTVDLGNDQFISQDASIQLNSNGNLGVGYTYQWSPPQGLDDTSAPSPIASPEITTEYQLRITDSHNCTATDSVLIGIIRGISIPDVFTPNGDGINDTWVLRGAEEYPEAEIMVFDRWGSLVYYQTGSKQVAFDGTYQSKSLPVGVYVYTIKTEPQASHTYRGHVLLLR
ncbi:gliding motility-associated C-terminal domain-containing protein [Runella zeae]|uniref:gliding motility-associated C-terminal domain-containing protein n=1 Tax=Runella zeae TaxID=94255 RepID=UPI00048D93CD|nr:T9SS C-terminal target domain-containing protein [Runella zeae]